MIILSYSDIYVLYYFYVLSLKNRVRHIWKSFRQCLHRMASRKAQKHKVVHFLQKNTFYVLNDQKFNI